MNTVEKLRILGAGTKWDACFPGHSDRKPVGNDRVGAPSMNGICKSFTPDGRCVSLLRVLQSNACVHDCKYCVNSSICKQESKTRFEPKELADLFMNFYTRNFVEGFFLSSGVAGNETVAFEQMYQTVSILRNKYQYQGYVHLKVMPGAHPSQIKALSEVADRISLNAECPNTAAFSELCTTKDYAKDVETRLRMVSRYASTKGGADSTTQFVVGAAGETDSEYIDSLEHLYSDLGVKKAYFSAFDALAGTPLEVQQSVPKQREHRLYQLDWLLRFYHFSFDEVKSMVDEGGMLPIHQDPKIAFALQNPDRFPVDPNSASLSELLHVPGIGVQGAHAILELREHQKIRSASDLKSTGIVVSRADPFLALSGFRQSTLSAFA